MEVTPERGNTLGRPKFLRPDLHLISHEKESRQAITKPEVDSGLMWSGLISITMRCSY